MNNQNEKDNPRSETVLPVNAVRRKKKPNTMKIPRSWLVVISIALVLAAWGGRQLWAAKQAGKDQAGSTTAEITRGDIRISALGSGALIPAEEVSFGFEQGGVVDQVLVGVGDEVQEGQALATLMEDDLAENLKNAQENYRELTSPASKAAAALEAAQAQRAVTNAEGNLKFLISPYVFKSEIRLQEAQDELKDAVRAQEQNPSQEAAVALAAAQQKVDQAQLSVDLNWETYYEEYVPDFFNFPWRDRFGYWHDYFAPPSDTEVDAAWAELDEAKASLASSQMYLGALTDGVIPADAYGSEITQLETSREDLTRAEQGLEAAVLRAPLGGVITDFNLSSTASVGTGDVATIARLDPPTLEAYFEESDWSLVVKGNPVEVVFDALPDKTYQGEIVFVDPVLQSRGGANSVYAVVELDTSKTGWSDLPLGSSASLEIVADQVQNAVLVPLDALQEDAGGSGTVIVDENGELSTREVEIGLRNVLYGEVLNGLSEGDLVVLGYSK